MWTSFFNPQLSSDIANAKAEYVYYSRWTHRSSYDGVVSKPEGHCPTPISNIAFGITYSPSPLRASLLLSINTCHSKCHIFKEDHIPELYTSFPLIVECTSLCHNDMKEGNRAIAVS